MTSAQQVSALVVAVLLSSPVACRSTGSGSTAPPEGFEVELELPPPPGNAAVVPPDGALSASRIWVNQEVPRQKKTPEWREIPAKQGAPVDMAVDGRWRCVVDAVKVHGRADEDATVAHWTTSRSVRCSTDGFRTFVQGLVREGYDPAGKPTGADPRAVLRLRDVVEGTARTTVVALEGAGPPGTRHRRTF